MCVCLYIWLNFLQFLLDGNLRCPVGFIRKRAIYHRGAHLPCMLSHFSRVQPFATLWTVAHQAPLSMGFSRQEYWSGLPFPSPMHACMLHHFSRVRLCATLWTAAHQAPLSAGFSSPEYCSELPFPSPMHACMLCHFSRVRLCETLWTAAHQAPLSAGFSSQEYWNGLPISFSSLCL